MTWRASRELRRAARAHGRAAPPRAATSPTSACSRQCGPCRASSSCRPSCGPGPTTTRALPIGAGQTISQPYMVARICEALALRGHERVLDVGTGSGYQAAVLACLAAEVHSIERVPELARRAESALAEAGYDGVHVHVGDGTLGLAEHAPFAAIAVGGSGAPVAAGALRAARAARQARRPGRPQARAGAAARRSQPRGPGRHPLGAVPLRPAPRRGGLRRESGRRNGERRRRRPLRLRSRPMIERAREAFTAETGFADSTRGAGAAAPAQLGSAARSSATVGATGYVVNLVVFSRSSSGAGLHYLPAAVCSFRGAVSNNYLWNRLWTSFHGPRPLRLSGHAVPRRSRGRVAGEPARARRARRARPDREVLAQALAIILVTPLNFVGNKLWSFRR